MKEKIQPTYGSFVIRIPQQDNPIYKEMFSNDYLDHFYEPLEIIVSWVFKAKFYLTEQQANEALKRLNKLEPTLNAEVMEARLNLFH